MITVLSNTTPDAGRLNLSFAKDTPGLCYVLESSPTLAGTYWRKKLISTAETNTGWSVGFESLPGVPAEFHRIRAMAAAITTS